MEVDEFANNDKNEAKRTLQSVICVPKTSQLAKNVTESENTNHGSTSVIKSKQTSRKPDNLAGEGTSASTGKGFTDTDGCDKGKGITPYRMAITKLRNARRLIERLGTKDPGTLSENDKTLLIRANQTVTNEELLKTEREDKDFYRKLQLKQKEESDRKKAIRQDMKESNRNLPADERRDNYKKRVRSDESKSGSVDKVPKSHQSQKYPATVKSRTFHSEHSRKTEEKSTSNGNDDKNLKLVVINELSSNGRMSRDIWMDLELKLITYIAEAECPLPPLQIDRTSWVKGHKVITCEDWESYKLLQEILPKLLVSSEVKIKCISTEEMELLDYPQAWVWIPTPHIPHKILIPAISRQNPSLDTSNWKILKEGPKRQMGQEWKLSLNRGCLQQLIDSQHLIRFGVGRIHVLPTQKDKDRNDARAVDGPDPNKSTA